MVDLLCLAEIKIQSNTQIVHCFSLKFIRVIDLGVMTPCEKILQTAIEERAGMINI